jgi:hypothetical protein
MIKEYDLNKQGLDFKSDFNWNFELIRHLLEIRTMRGYLKIDLIKSKSQNKIYLSRRTTNFDSQKAIFEIKEFFCSLEHPYCLLSS